jgi:regulatory protein YycH of two-component signal transduction system YycFG
MPVKIPKTDQNNNVNMLYNDLIADYELSSVDFVVAGYDMIFNNDQRSTIVRIVPSEFMEYDKTLKLMKPKVI